ncbi:hypothetical protein [Hanstruepera flava]|uniref:hypothetical protein n=1 Tax=Hanstruepera flava TaxID=2930218 RepID=UPI0020285977|nr:hypothetical protein [Hanstruepera flava]
MRIEFKKNRLYVNLIIGILWMSLGVYKLIFGNQPHWFEYSYFLLGAIYLGMVFNELIYPYLKIDGGVVTMNILYGNGKSLQLKNIKRIKKFSNQYILMTDNNEMKINVRLIDSESLIKLEAILKALSLPVSHTPFYN